MRLLLFSAFIFTFGHANAVESTSTTAAASSNVIREKGVALIPTAGLAIFSAVGGNRSSIESTQGFAGGLLTDMDIATGGLQFETGLLFMQQGDAVSRTNFTRTANYLSIPILAKYRFLKTGPVGFHIRGGLSPALLLNPKTDRGFRGANLTREAKSEMKEYDIQPTLGFGSTFDVSSTRAISLDLTYMRGLVSFLKSRQGSIYNEGFVISAGMIF